MTGSAVVLRDVMAPREGLAGAIELLPTWFGIPEAHENDVGTANTHPSVIASIDGDEVGITTVQDHSRYAAELFLMTVQPSDHRRGVGTAMLRHLEAELATAGVEFLQVKIVQ
jgi:GNAT superfamily N-acetyltransferase